MTNALSFGRRYSVYCILAALFGGYHLADWYALRPAVSADLGEWK